MLFRSGDFLIQTPTSAYSTKLIVKDDGNVGIGTTSPAAKLYVVSSGSPIARFDGSSVAASSATEIDVLGPQSNGDLNLGIGGSTFTDATNNIQNKAFVTAGTGLSGLNLRSDAGYVQITAGGVASSYERMRITSDGNVGIGTTSPGAKLDVYSTSSINTSNYYGLSKYNASLTSNVLNGQVGILFSALSNNGLPANASIHTVPISEYRSGIVSTYSADAFGAGYFYVNQFIPV